MTTTTKSVERLFPFIKRARTLIVGQHVILRSKSQLHFVLLTHDISDRGKSEALRKFKHYPVVQRYRSADLQKFFDLRGVKLVGFRKSGLSKSLYAELKPYRINEPVEPKKEEEASPSKTPEKTRATTRKPRDRSKSQKKAPLNKKAKPRPNRSKQSKRSATKATPH